MRDCLDHYYHKPCIEAMLSGSQHLKCPVCMSVYGTMTGDQPAGTMTVTADPALTCDGHPPGTLVIEYNMKSGIRNGVRFPGTHRTAYIPDHPEGREVVELLKRAF
jgi:deltex-like protein